MKNKKSAIIASANLPQYLWLASASLGTLTLNRLKVLKGRNMVLFPDLDKPNSTNPYEIWNELAQKAQKQLQLNITLILFYKNRQVIN